MEHDETKSSPIASEAAVLSSQDQEAPSAIPLADEVGLHSEEASRVAPTEEGALHHEEASGGTLVDPVDSTDEEDVLAVETLEEYFLGPDDDGAMQTKYGGPAMVHPGGDLTVRVAQECPLLVTFNGTKHEVFSPGDSLPTDLWTLESGLVVAARPMTLHTQDGGVVVALEGTRLPTTCIVVETGEFYRP